MAYGPGQAYPAQPALPANTGPANTGPANTGPWPADTGSGPADTGSGTMWPAVNPSWLAGTADRERTAGVLRAGFTEGRLTQDELDERMAQAYAARTYADLWALTADLPAGPLPLAFSPYPPGTVVAPDAAPATSWQSGVALLVVALVIFTLAALVTAILTTHGQPGMLTPSRQPGMVTPFQQVNLAPFITGTIKA